MRLRLRMNPNLNLALPYCGNDTNDQSPVTNLLGWQGGRGIIENPDERLRLGQRGREFYKRHFNRDEIQDRLLQAYQSPFEE